MKKVRIELALTDKEYNFLKWLALYDNKMDNTRKWTVHTELANLTELQLRETMEAYCDCYITEEE